MLLAQYDWKETRFIEVQPGELGGTGRQDGIGREIQWDGMVTQAEHPALLRRGLIVGMSLRAPQFDRRVHRGGSLEARRDVEHRMVGIDPDSHHIGAGAQLDRCRLQVQRLLEPFRILKGIGCEADAQPAQLHQLVELGPGVGFRDEENEIAVALRPDVGGQIAIADRQGIALILARARPGHIVGAHRRNRGSGHRTGRDLDDITQTTNRDEPMPCLFAGHKTTRLPKNSYKMPGIPIPNREYSVRCGTATMEAGTPARARPRHGHAQG